MGALNGNRVEDLRDQLAERDNLIKELFGGLIDIENAALTGLTNHRDIIYGICLRLKEKKLTEGFKL